MACASSLVSNGTGLFPLSWLAGELHRSGRLDCLLTAGYLKAPVDRFVERSPWLADLLSRLIGRTVDLPQDKVVACWTAELFYQIAAKTRGRYWGRAVSEMADAAAFRRYASAAAQLIAGHPNPPPLYHYRAAFGLQSVALAKRRGMIAVCHHTSAHPLTIGPLNRNGGRAPTPEQVSAERRDLAPLQRLILEDIDQADFIVAESDFEIETFRWAGFTGTNIRAFYPGIDPVFRQLVPDRPIRRPGPPRLLFAGQMVERKGIGVLQEALASDPTLDFTLEIAGSLLPEDAVTFAPLLSDPRVRYLGVLKRADLASRMADSDIFVLPTFSEGSVRVVFEALACGCVVVTTPNSGTVAQDGRNGVLVAPGDPEALLAGIRRAFDMAGRWAEIAVENRRLALEDYTPHRFVGEISALYDQLAGVA